MYCTLSNNSEIPATLLRPIRIPGLLTKEDHKGI